MQLKNFVILLSAPALLASCKGGLFGKNKKASSEVTGWNYNDKNMGGYQVSKAKEQPTGPGLVFVPGGTFTMGQTEEDVMGNWDNIPRRVTVPSFYMDRTEVANVHYREYIFWLNRIFDPTQPQNQAIINGALPDTLAWRSELSYNEPLVEYYFRHPGFNDYPVVGVSWKQAYDFCLWRSDRVNEAQLMKKGYIDKKHTNNQQDANNFTTKSYLLGLHTVTPGKGATSKKNPLKTPQGQPRTNVTMEDGILQPDYRLPFEAEWEYAAYGYVANNPRPSKKEGKRGEELVTNKQVYPWTANMNYSGLRETKHGSWHGQFLANFKRGSGDNAGVAGGLNDRAIYTAPVKSFWPNGFGLYNMAGNVSEWVADVYRPMTNLDADDVAPFRGNKFTKLYKDPNGEYQINDTTGRVKTVAVTDAEVKDRRNYQRGNVINFLDGDSLSDAAYGYGKTTLVSDKSRVYKGGSWNDRAYWLSPGTRRYLEEEQASSQIGFRCAMDRMGSPEGKGRKTGNYWRQKKQKR